MKDEREQISELVVDVCNSVGTERGAVCARDCLLQWKLGLLQETIEAWRRYLEEVKNKDGHCSENRHQSWVPAIPL